MFSLVLRADNIPHIKRKLRPKRRFFVTVTNLVTTKKTESVQINGQTVHWNQRLGALYDFPFSILFLGSNFCSVLHNGLHISHCVCMRNGTYTLMTLSERTRCQYLSNPKLVRILLEISLVRLAEHLGDRRSLCSQS